MTRQAIITKDGVDYFYTEGASAPENRLKAYNVFFRPNGRTVFEYGDLWDNPRENLRDYHVKLTEDGNVLLDQDIPYHQVQARITVRTQPVKVIKTPAQLMRERRAFPVAFQLRLNASGLEHRLFKGPLDSAGITLYFGTTGERPDIGWITDPTANFLLTGNPWDMLQWAFACSTIPWFVTDKNTGRIISKQQYPDAGCYGDERNLQNQYPFWQGPPAEYDNPRWCAPEPAHQPELSGMAAQATEDLGFLEDLQFTVRFPMLVVNNKNKFGVPIMSGLQVRECAWNIVRLAHCLRLTKEAEERLGADFPTWLEHSDAYQETLDAYLEWLGEEDNDPFWGEPLKTFGLLKPDNAIGPWQTDYLAIALAFMCWMGFTQAEGRLRRVIQSAIDRCSGLTEFPPGYGTPYFFDLFPDRDFSKPAFKSWGEAYRNDIDRIKKNNRKLLDGLTGDQYDTTLAWVEDQEVFIDDFVAKLAADPFNGGKAMFGNEYMMTTRGALLATKLCVDDGIIAPIDNLDLAYGNAQKMFEAYDGLNPRLALTLDKSKVVDLIDESVPDFNPAPSPGGGGSAPPPVEEIVDPVPAPPDGWLPQDIDDWVIVRVPADAKTFYLPDIGHGKRVVIGNGTTVVDYWTSSGNVHDQAGTNYSDPAGPSPMADGGFYSGEHHSNGDEVRYYGVPAVRFYSDVVHLLPAKTFDTQPTENPPMSKIDEVLAQAQSIDDGIGNTVKGLVRSALQALRDKIAELTATPAHPATEFPVPAGFDLVETAKLDALKAHLAGIEADFQDVQQASQEQA